MLITITKSVRAGEEWDGGKCLNGSSHEFQQLRHPSYSQKTQCAKDFIFISFFVLAPELWGTFPSRWTSLLILSNHHLGNSSVCIRQADKHWNVSLFFGADFLRSSEIKELENTQRKLPNPSSIECAPAVCTSEQGPTGEECIL